MLARRGPSNSVPSLPLELIHAIVLIVISPPPIFNRQGIIQVYQSGYQRSEKCRLHNCTLLLRVCKRFYQTVQPQLWHSIQADYKLPGSTDLVIDFGGDAAWPSGELLVQDPQAYHLQSVRVKEQLRTVQYDWIAKRRLDLAFSRISRLSTLDPGRPCGAHIRVLDLSSCPGITLKGFERLFKCVRRLDVLLLPTCEIEDDYEPFLADWGIITKLSQNHPLRQFFTRQHFQLLSIGWTQQFPLLDACLDFLAIIPKVDHLHFVQDMAFEEDQALVIHTKMCAAFDHWGRSLASLTISDGYKPVLQLFDVLHRSAPNLEILDYTSLDMLDHTDQKDLTAAAAALLKLTKLHTVSFKRYEIVWDYHGALDELLTNHPKLRAICTNSEMLSPTIFQNLPANTVSSVTILLNAHSPDEPYAKLLESSIVTTEVLNIRKRAEIEQMWQLLQMAEGVPWDTVPDFTRERWRPNGQKLYRVGKFLTAGLTHLECADLNCTCHEVDIRNRDNLSPDYRSLATVY